MALPQTTPPPSRIETLSYINGMAEAFRAFNSDNDGLITGDELSSLMGSLGYKANGRGVRKTMMRRGDGILNAEEFLETVTYSVEFDAGELAGLLEAALTVLDADVDDEAVVVTATGEELYEVLSGMGRLSVKDCMDIVASMDGDGEGAVNIEDLEAHCRDPCLGRPYRARRLYYNDKISYNYTKAHIV